MVELGLTALLDLLVPERQQIILSGVLHHAVGVKFCVVSLTSHAIIEWKV